MRIRLFISVMLVVVAGGGLSAPFDLESLHVPRYKVDDYIRAAISLQAMGRDAACKTLLASATNDVIDQAACVLCRMLFKQRGTNDFRPPFQGGQIYSIGLESDWPLAPIALIEGIPFLLIEGGGANGPRSPESSESYLRYCMTNCDWNTFKFREVSSRQKKDALEKLLSLTPEGQHLRKLSKERLQSQIE